MLNVNIAKMTLLFPKAILQKKLPIVKKIMMILKRNVLIKYKKNSLNQKLKRF